MKKSKRQKFRPLALILLLLMLAGCSVVPNEQSQETKPPLPASPSSEPTDTPTEPTTTQPLPPKTPSEEAPQQTIALKPDLIQALTDELLDRFADHDMGSNALEAKIRRMKAGERALRLKIDSGSYYYACAYFEPKHPREKKDICCIEQYTWIGFETEYAIREQIDGKSLVIAFQINKMSICQDILHPEAPVPAVEHYQEYLPNFCEGDNIATPLKVDGSFIQLFRPDKSNLYCAMDAFVYPWAAISTLETFGQCYLILPLYYKDESGIRQNNDLRYDLGEYYDAFMEVIITNDFYIHPTEYFTRYYGLLPLETFITIIGTNN